MAFTPHQFQVLQGDMNHSQEHAQVRAGTIPAQTYQLPFSATMVFKYVLIMLP